MSPTRSFYARYSAGIKRKARQLRRRGMTHREIARELRIGTGTAHEWTKGMSLSERQKSAMYARIADYSWTTERRNTLSQIAKVRFATYYALRLYTREELLQKIIDFYEKNGRIPLKREFNMYHQYKREFGGWNSAIRIAGFDTNPELFAHKFKSSDGHSCDSFTERIIDDWLSDNNIVHQRNWPYGDTKMTADFFIERNTVLEFFGLAGVQSKYDATIRKKRKFCNRSGLRLVEMYPRDLFPINRISDKLGSFLKS